LATKPTVGGIPASESRNRVSRPAAAGLRRASPAYAESEVWRSPRAETTMTTPNAPITVAAYATR
jgi:hypothetical protein